MNNVYDVCKPKSNIRVVGDKIGIELEYEGKNLSEYNNFPEGCLWSIEQDGSLLPDKSCEYVLGAPLSVTDAFKQLDMLSTSFKIAKTEFFDSVRTGIHIHLNVQQFTMTQLYNLFTLYLTFEEALVAWCGDRRVGNLFCLRAVDAGMLTATLSEAAILRDFKKLFYNDDMRYGSINVKSLFEYGTVEFRAMQGTSDIDRIKTWIIMLDRLRSVARKFDNPTQIIQQFSLLGGPAFLKKVMGKEANLLEVSQGFEESLFSGMRNAQEVAFCTDWDKFEESVNRKFVKHINNNVDPEFWKGNVMKKPPMINVKGLEPRFRPVDLQIKKEKDNLWVEGQY